MKILISAYACNPYRGSEPGVGWNAVCNIAKRHEVYVLTDVRNQEAWDHARERGEVPEGVSGVRFLRKREKMSQHRLLAHMQSWRSYGDFMNVVHDAALKWHREVDFDLCHQLTIASWRLPSKLWMLPIPFVWGPIGGAGHIPAAFRSSLGLSGRAFEKARDIQTLLAARSQDFRRCVERSRVVIAANDETFDFLSSYRDEQTMLKVPVAFLANEKIERFDRGDLARRDGPMRLFAGGNMIGSKGLAMAVEALASIRDEGVEFHYTIAGGGPSISEAKRLVDRHQLGNSVRFHPGFQGEDYIWELKQSDIYFLPSLRETTPVTLQEAILAGCYPIVADASAAGEMVRRVGGKAVAAKSPKLMVSGLALALHEAHGELKTLRSKAIACRAKLCQEYGKDNYEDTIEEAYRACIK